MLALMGRALQLDPTIIRDEVIEMLGEYDQVQQRTACKNREQILTNKPFKELVVSKKTLPPLKLAPDVALTLYWARTFPSTIDSIVSEFALGRQKGRRITALSTPDPAFLQMP